MDPTLESLLTEEKDLSLSSFSNDDAWELGARLADLARARKLPIAISIVRGGQRLFHFAAEGTSPDNDAWLERKLATVLHFGHSSLFMGKKLEALGLGLQEKYSLDPARYSVSGGAFPIAIAGTGLVGGVAVSGLKAEEDHALVVEALAGLKKAAS